jgi:hypothetical protein
VVNHDNGADVLLEAHQLVTGPRQETYSHPYDDYTKVVAIFHALTGVDLSLDQALLFMVSVKMARLRTNLAAGNLHRDSLVDAAGYLACLAMVDKVHRESVTNPWEPYFDKGWAGQTGE